MATEHHMYVSMLIMCPALELKYAVLSHSDSFDLASFFQLHDLNRYGSIESFGLGLLSYFM